MSQWARLRESFLFMPGVFCLGAVVLAEGLIALDRRVGELDLGPFGYLINQVGAAGSRDLLGAIAGSMLTVAATTFSITIAVLALSSATYGPRLVRNFMTDRGNQVVLGVYVATFLYSLLVLRSIRTIEGRGEGSFVPHLAVNAAVLLAVVSIGVLVYFIHHISDSVQVWTLARQVRSAFVDSGARFYPKLIGHDSQDVESAQGADDVPGGLDSDGATVRAAQTGYVQSVGEELLGVASKHDVIVSLLVRPGSHINEGGALAVVWPPDRADENLSGEVHDAISIGQARTPYQDVDFAVLLLEEMAVRALSPSTNDPYTAINALDDLSAGMVLIAGVRSPSVYRYDGQRQLRVCAPRVELSDLLDRVLDAMRLYAIGHPSVLHRTLVLVQQTGTASGQHDLRARLAMHVERILEAFERSSPQSCDLEELRRHAVQVTRSLRSPREDGPANRDTTLS